MKILCRTLFDCTYTGVTGTFRANQLPFDDRSGKTIEDQAAWEYARNQQRNWETIMQMISLRAQPTVEQFPKHEHDTWYFVFAVEVKAVYSATGQDDNYDTLLNECHGIPMIIGLDETQPLQSRLIGHGQAQNIWFESVNNA